MFWIITIPKWWISNTRYKAYFLFIIGQRTDSVELKSKNIIRTEINLRVVYLCTAYYFQYSNFHYFSRYLIFGQLFLFYNHNLQDTLSSQQTSKIYPLMPRILSCSFKCTFTAFIYLSHVYRILIILLQKSP